MVFFNRNHCVIHESIVCVVVRSQVITIKFVQILNVGIFLFHCFFFLNRKWELDVVGL